MIYSNTDRAVFAAYDRYIASDFEEDCGAEAYEDDLDDQDKIEEMYERERRCAR